MKYGILSHHCHCGDKLYTRHTITLDNNGYLLGIEPFTAETANTLFCDDVLLVVATGFARYASQFLTSLQQQYATDSGCCVTELIMSDELYSNNMAHVGEQCHIYAISNIDKATLRPIDTPQMTRIRL